jgi:site-specific DNA-methyltransferase (adenine-specific)
MQNMNIYRGNFLSDEFNEHFKNVWGVDNFDYIIQNPPYQELIEGNKRMRTLYNVFIDKALTLTDKLICIHPSRWMAGGFGLDEFRNQMFQRNDIKVIKHWDNSQDVFGKVVEIKGGVQYFLIDKSYDGLCNYNGVDCKLNSFDIFVEPKFHSIVSKFDSKPSLKDICKSKSFWMNFNDKELSEQKNDVNTICYVSQNKGLIKYIDINLIPKNSKRLLDKFKVFTPYATGSTGNLGYFGNKIIGLPGETCSNTYMTFFVASKEEAESLVSYMETKFAEFFLSLRKNTQNMKPDTMKWIPMVPFDREWSDEMLFEYFELTEEEKELILNK